MRILDGNHLGKTEHRLDVLRGTSAGALPGQTLVLLDPQRMVIDDVIPCEDGHAQERSMLDEVLPIIKPRDLIIDDRNFCTLAFLFALMHAGLTSSPDSTAGCPWTPLGKARYIGLTETGRVYEQDHRTARPRDRQKKRVRRITVKLKTPTRDGDMEIHLLTNLPASDLGDEGSRAVPRSVGLWRPRSTN